MHPLTHYRFLSVSRVFAGAHNDLTKLHFDNFCQAVRDGKYEGVKVPLISRQGVVVEYQNAVYLMCDGGYHKWKCMQGPSSFPESDREVRFNSWVESLRKDVECAFGILKKRFRCVKLPFLWKDMRDCECVFVTCCMLHNMLVDHKMEMFGGWSMDEVAPPNYADPRDDNPITRWRPANDRTDWFQLVDAELAEGVEVEGGYRKWRHRYIDHFYYQWVRKQTVWPGPTEPNSSLRTPLPL